GGHAILVPLEQHLLSSSRGLPSPQRFVLADGGQYIAIGMKCQRADPAGMPAKRDGFCHLATAQPAQEQNEHGLLQLPVVGLACRGMTYACRSRSAIGTYVGPLLTLYASISLTPMRLNCTILLVAILLMASGARTEEPKPCEVLDGVRAFFAKT